MFRRRTTGALTAVVVLACALPGVAGARSLSGPSARLSQPLRSLVAADRAGASVPARARRVGVPVTPAERVAVDVAVRDGVPSADVAAALRDLGMTVAATTRRAPEPLVEGLLPVAALVDAAALPGVSSVSAIHPAQTDAGSVTSEGDAAHRGPQVRAQGATGQGVSVGVISDSIDQVGGGVAASKATGDLPSAVDVLKDEAGGSDEGRAMGEIVYDEAPGISSLLFASGTGNGASHGLGAANKADSIDRLVAAGANVIADDIYMIDEPFFQDGAVAQAVDRAAAAGVAYFASAGNRARQSYEGTARFAGPPGTNDYDDFDPGLGTDAVQTIGTVANGRGAGIALQWDEAWGAATSDLDIELVNVANNAVLASSQDDNLTTGVPRETTWWQNSTGATVTVGLRIARFKGTRQPLLKWIAYGSWGTPLAPEYATASPTINPDAASAAGSIAVAAIAAGDAGLDTPETFSSRGPATRLFAADGTRFGTPQVRAKPDLSAADGVMTTVPGFKPFYGTSAATPSAAGVAALLLSADPNLGVSGLRDAMTAPASTISCVLAGLLQTDCGAGFVLADQALSTLLSLVGSVVPAITSALTGEPPNAAGWSRGDVGVRFDVVGGLLVTLKSGCDPFTLTTDGVQEVTCSVTSLSGLVSRAVTLRRDGTPPSTPVVSGLPDGPLAASAMPAASAIGCSASDATSGMASCAVTGYDTTPGTHTLTATATDVAGNRSTAVRTYVVDADPAVIVPRRVRASDVVVLPSSRACRRRPATLSIALKRSPAGLPVVRSVKLAATGLRARIVRRVPARVRLRGLRRAKVVLRVTVTFADGTRSVLSRTYRTCRPGGDSPLPLK